MAFFSADVKDKARMRNEDLRLLSASCVVFWTSTLGFSFSWPSSLVKQHGVSHCDRLQRSSQLLESMPVSFRSLQKSLKSKVELPPRWCPVCDQLTIYDLFWYTVVIQLMYRTQHAVGVCLLQHSSVDNCLSRWCQEYIIDSRNGSFANVLLPGVCCAGFTVVKQSTKNTCLKNL